MGNALYGSKLSHNKLVGRTLDGFTQAKRLHVEPAADTILKRDRETSSHNIET